ncbi:MAG TPA: EthD domain-containing protein [Pseudonocardia sp.]|nr:EthD domain-containing protein [Pseudonocardia sp.]
MSELFKVFGYLNKRADLDTEAFIDHYEHTHVPLILSLAPAPDVYKRHYVRHTDELNLRESALDFDVMTELGFRDRDAFVAWLASVSSGAAGKRVAADEARFLDRARTRSCVTEDHVTTA